MEKVSAIIKETSWISMYSNSGKWGKFSRIWVLAFIVCYHKVGFCEGSFRRAAFPWFWCALRKM